MNTTNNNLYSVLQGYKGALEKSIIESGQQRNIHNAQATQTRNNIRQAYANSLRDGIKQQTASNPTAQNQSLDHTSRMEKITEELQTSLKITKRTAQVYSGDFNNHLNSYGPIPGKDDTIFNHIKNFFIRVTNNILDPAANNIYTLLYLLNMLTLIVAIPVDTENTLGPTEQQALNLNNPANNQTFTEYTDAINTYVNSSIEAAQQLPESFSPSLANTARSALRILIPIKIFFESLKLNINRKTMPELYRHHGLIPSMTKEEAEELGKLMNNILYMLLTTIPPVGSAVAITATRQNITNAMANLVDSEVQKTLLNPDAVSQNLINKLTGETPLINQQILMQQVQEITEQATNTTMPFLNIVHSLLTQLTRLGTNRIVDTLLVPLIVAYMKAMYVSSNSPLDENAIINEIQVALKEVYGLPNKTIQQIMKGYKENLTASYFNLPDINKIRKAVLEAWKYGPISYLSTWTEYLKNVITGPTQAALNTLENRRKDYQEALGKTLFHFSEFMQECQNQNLTDKEIRDRYTEICKNTSFGYFSFDEMKDFLKKYVLQNEPQLIDHTNNPPEQTNESHTTSTRTINNQLISNDEVDIWEDAVETQLDQRDENSSNLQTTLLTNTEPARNAQDIRQFTKNQHQKSKSTNSSKLRSESTITDQGYIGIELQKMTHPRRKRKTPRKYDPAGSHNNNTSYTGKIKPNSNNTNLGTHFVDIEKNKNPAFVNISLSSTSSTSDDSPYL